VRDAQCYKTTTRLEESLHFSLSLPLSLSLFLCVCLSQNWHVSGSVPTEVLISCTRRRLQKEPALHPRTGESVNPCWAETKAGGFERVVVGGAAFAASEPGGSTVHGKRKEKTVENITTFVQYHVGSISLSLSNVAKLALLCFLATLLLRSGLLY
jgi:hypothetical protein